MQGREAVQQDQTLQELVAKVQCINVVACHLRSRSAKADGSGARVQVERLQNAFDSLSDVVIEEIGRYYLQLTTYSTAGAMLL